VIGGVDGERGDVTVRAASGTDLTLLRNLFPLYLHELTAFTDFYEVDDEGRFFPDYLREWVERSSPMLLPYVLAEGDKPAGFALVARAPYPFMGAARDYRMCEFFVLNRSRRRGVGRRAAHALFAMHAGVWEVSELPNNDRAIAFWRRVIAEYTGGSFAEAGERGDVVQVFDGRR
jgi:predicted acetyltransferase